MAIYKIQGENAEVFGEEHFSRRIRTEYACNYTEAQIRRRLPDLVHRFRVKDDDGVTYFWGVCSDPDSFAPLDQEGAEYGATTIEYKDPHTGRYEAL